MAYGFQFSGDRGSPRSQDENRSERALSGYALVHLNVLRRKSRRQLCQNCVTFPPKPLVNTVIYGDTLTHIVVAGSR